MTPPDEMTSEEVKSKKFEDYLLGECRDHLASEKKIPKDRERNMFSLELTKHVNEIYKNITDTRRAKGIMGSTENQREDLNETEKTKPSGARDKAMKMDKKKTKHQNKKNKKKRVDYKNSEDYQDQLQQQIDKIQKDIDDLLAGHKDINDSIMRDEMENFNPTSQRTKSTASP